MERITLDEASRDLGGLIDSLASRGTTIEVERDECIIATIVPAKPTPPHICRTMNDFAELLNSLPRLGEDAEVFERDIADAQYQLHSSQGPLPSSGMTMMEFGEFLASLPSLGDDSEAFERDIAEMRNFYLPEVDAWQ